MHFSAGKILIFIFIRYYIASCYSGLMSSAFEVLARMEKVRKFCERMGEKVNGCLSLVFPELENDMLSVSFVKYREDFNFRNAIRQFFLKFI